jgi:hypothetical protein
MNPKIKALLQKARKQASSQATHTLIDAIEALLEEKPVSVRPNAPKKKAGAKLVAPVPASEKSAS